MLSSALQGGLLHFSSVLPGKGFLSVSDAYHKIEFIFLTSFHLCKEMLIMFFQTDFPYGKYD